jgi:flagellar hook-basal body complex protein FliE
MLSNLLSTAVAAATGGGNLPHIAPTAATQGSGAPPFSGLLQDAITSEQGLEDQASSAVQGLMSGSGVDVHRAMIATQKANLAFEMALAVRNKAVAAYQQVMQIQF